MKKQDILISLLFLMLFTSQLIAQPFNLDPEIKPVKLDLIDDKDVEGASGVITYATIDDTSHYWFAKVDMFRPVDVYVFSNFKDADLKIDIANANWEDVSESQNTGSVKNGIAHFKLRTEGDFGIQVHPGNEKINYTIAIYAHPPVKEYLGSAFRKARPDEFNTSTTTNNTSDNDGGATSSENTILYVALGIALLVIGFLLAMFLIKRKSAKTVLIFILSTTVQIGFAQEQDDETFGPGKFTTYEEHLDNEYIREKENNRVEEIESESNTNLDIDQVDYLGSKVNSFLETYKAGKSAYDSYKSLRSCASNTPPPGMPKIPSFCVTDDCEDCFLDARSRFNENRYKFERLKTIYNCTKNYTDRMIAFGDNVSGYHGVSGLAWQAQKTKVLKSLAKLKVTYDTKYTELLNTQQEILMELSACEAAYGIEDWYDRFGYIYYDFTKMNYARKE